VGLFSFVNFWYYKNMSKNCIAYIDASNLKFGIEQSNWKLDYKSFRSWLRDKLGVSRVILFLGLIPDNSDLYNYLQSIGYDISFKPTITSKDGRTKGNVDGELILTIAKDFYENNLPLHHQGIFQAAILQRCCFWRPCYDL